jgi:hypothetical protein
MTKLRLVLALVGYAGCYVPFCWFPSKIPLPPLALLPVSTVAGLLAMLLLTTVMGWWGQVRGAAASWSGAFTSLIFLSTPLAYAIPGVPPVTSSTIMKGATTALGPVMDLWNGEKIRWESWVAVLMCAIALAAGVKTSSLQLTATAGVIYVVYVLAYAARLRLMRNHRGSRGFFVTEHLVTNGTGLLLVLLASLFSKDVRLGWSLAAWADWRLWTLGLASQGVGLFGGWILLYRRECSFTLPLNRSGAMFASTVVALVTGAGVSLASGVGVGLVLGAVFLLYMNERSV